MKIAYCLSQFNVTGGIERIVSIKANWLVAHGYDVTFIIRDQEGLPVVYALDERVKTVDLNVPGEMTSRLQWRSPMVKEYRKKLEEHLLATHYDIVISTDYTCSVYFLPKIKDGSKKIIEYHGAIHFRQVAAKNLPLRTRLLKTVITYYSLFKACKFDRVVALSTTDFNEWKRYTSKAVRIPNAVTIEPSAISTCENKEVIAVGRIDRHKGFEYLLDAWALVLQRHPDWHLSIYGEMRNSPKYQKELAEQVERLHLPADTFKGNSKNIAEHYAESSIYVCSSETESFALVIVEAAVCGLPAVSFDCPTGPRDIIEDGKTGYLVPKVGDVQGMAKALCRLIEDDALRKQMGAAAREASKRFSLDNVMRQWEQLFAEVLNEK